MGEVYIARDSKLGRDVAIKVLPDSVAGDPMRLARFEREARLLASLNHPHIAQIYGLEHAPSTRSEQAPVQALVMELVDGPTLADRIDGGRMSMREALRIARQIAEALEAAHEQGIVHRDLKPANIKLTARGDVKVLDFGLATMREEDPERVAYLPTQEISSPNAIVGTPAYMAPEQAKGKPATHAADIWAFGCVLFALISGKPPFAGTTTPEILAEVLKSEPDWTRLPSDTPPAIRRTLGRCLAKDVRERFHHIADVRLALEDADDTPAVAARRPPWRERAAWIVAAVGISSAAIFFTQRPAAPPERRFDIVTPPEADAGGIALSPDGTNIAYTALSKGVPYLYVRSLENGSVRTLAGTEGAALPFWSPAGDAVAFFAESRLKRVNLATGAIQSLATATLSPAGGSWNSDGTIVFAPNIRGRVLRMSADGGEVSEVVPEGRSPRFLSDGRRFLFLDLKGVSVGSLDSREVTPLPDKVAWFALPGPPGYLTYMKREGRGQLFVQAFDEEALTLSGAETVIAERVQTATDGISASATVSQTGIIAVREVTGEVQPRRISEFDRTGTEIRRFGELGGLSPSASPDFDYVAVSRATGGNAVYLLELARGILTPFTAGPADQAAVWSPDGRNIVFSTARRGRVEMFMKPADGGEERPLIESPPDGNSRVATDWVGDVLLFRENSTTTNFDVFALPMSGADRRPVPVVRTEASERDAQLSPDMKWVAYESDKSGRSEIYLTRFRGGPREFQISPGGGAQVRWNPANRNELFYVALDGRLMSIRLEFASDDAAVRASNPVTLFQTHIGTVLQGPQKQQYVVSKDGQRFLVSHVIEDALSPIRLILNWKPRSS
jgi:Tol biopolymer transport system component